MNHGKSSGRFLWWCAGVLLIPMVGLLFLQQLNSIWVLIVLLTNAALFFQLGFVEGTNVDRGSSRMLFLVLSSIFSVMSIAWAVRLAIRIYVSGSLGV